LNIVLAGQPQLADKLATPELQQLRQRIAVMSRIRPLTSSETAEYIKHRLTCAGYLGAALFTEDALQAVAKGSLGTPRTINNICHQALCAAALAGTLTVNVETVWNVVARLEGREIELPPPGLEVSIKVEAPSVETPLKVEVSQPVPPSTVQSPAPPAIPAAPMQIPDAPIVAPVVSAASVSSAVPAQPEQPEGKPTLTYGAAEDPYSNRRRFAAAASCMIVLATSSYLLPSVRNVAKQEYRSLISHARADSRDSNAVSGTDSALGSGLPTFDPAPQESGSGQVITVAPKTGQTIEELSRLYAGHYDAQLYQKIYALNPDLKNPDNLESGQLIRLPLPPGPLKKVVDTSAPSSASMPGKLESAIAKVKEMFTSGKR